MYEPNGKAGATERGIFLNQDPTFDPALPNYSVKAISPQPITINGRTHTFYFQNWDYDQNKINLQYPTALETGVVFKDQNAVLKANMKGTQLSSDPMTYTNSSQRKFIGLHNNIEMLHVYSSMDKTWLESSNDNGNTWTLRNNGKPLTQQNSKLPSICQIGQSMENITSKFFCLILLQT